MSKDLLIEIGTEELPPTSLKALSEAFTSGIENGLTTAKLQFGEVKSFATPRRLAVLIKGLDEKTPVEEVAVWGPPANIAFDDAGKPTKAAEAFAKKSGIDVSALVAKSDGKVDKLFFAKSAGGEKTESLIGDIIRTSLDNLPIKKRMRWGASRSEFVRPVHWSLILFGDTVLNENILDTQSSNKTFGHRFHFNQQIEVSTPDEYESLLKDTGKVIADFSERQNVIVEQVKQCAESLEGEAVISEDLLDEVTALVEWPVPLAGNFDEEFLQVPAEALISSMKEHQKYFHVVDANGKLLPNFITVANLDSADAREVIEGNERVIRPRLADAAFFFETDKKTNLVAQRERLKNVVFQAQLGTIFDKTERIKKLALFIAEKIAEANSDKVARAAELCKSDLVSSMVYEFPDMQGIAGYHYALNDGEDAEVAQAIVEQYMPKFAGDDLPETTTGAIIALADRLDTITGIFGIGQIPTGSKDPFALRRASLGALRILVEKGYALDLEELITQAATHFTGLDKAQTVVNDVLNYMLERFRAWYEEDYPAEVFQAVHAKQLSVPVDINKRVHAVAEFKQLKEAPALAAANKRVSNILNKQDQEIAQHVDEALLQEDAEKQLASELKRLQDEVSPIFAAGDYTKALSALAALQQPVDNFFDNVMVMADDESLKNNRLALLGQLRALFLEVADISYLDVKK
ncbi:glycine--tRNA ligase subunit beta [Teredinibacter sp. KSP-S5-2]|uniref:glycine--tRNA ligase subunit beta n=1 Tax=Teredinibacter sp. KSP-S5-2 TaxID=3034506 RepID=UPI0029349131|nr:glycine--tRNA ligase subunit beta [Teredinibacter sp. KSP-S5-2]WNO09155.1 glycine--tRNA ligase subunit beta [Teredinibacter sp. KSP-S5-2]